MKYKISFSMTTDLSFLAISAPMGTFPEYVHLRDVIYGEKEDGRDKKNPPLATVQFDANAL